MLRGTELYQLKYYINFHPVSVNILTRDRVYRLIVVTS